MAWIRNAVPTVSGFNPESQKVQNNEPDFPTNSYPTGKLEIKLRFRKVQNIEPIRP